MTYTAAEKVYMSGNWTEAAGLFDSYMDKFPTGKFSLNATYYRGDCNLKLHSNEQAKNDFLAVIENTQQILLDLLQQKGLKVLIMKQPCATLKSKQGGPKKTVRVNQDKCLGDGCGCDKFCSRVWGCPGNSWDFEKGKAVIDPVSCVGCGVCAKLCPAGAIEVEGGAEE